MDKETRLCRKCGKEKPITEFYKSTRGGCKACVRAYQNRWYQEHKAVKKKRLPEGQRRCGKCHEIKSVNQFYRDRSNVSGYHHYCKACSDAMKKERLARKRATMCGPEIPDHLKQCAGCKRILSRSEFYKLPSSKDGLRSRCKDCEREYKRSEAGKRSARKYADKPEVKKRRNAQRREQRAKGEAQWVINELEYRREYNQQEEVKERNKKHEEAYRKRPENREKARLATIKWRQENPEQEREQSRIKYIRKKGAKGWHTLDQWLELLDLCDYKCLACGTDGELHRDHIQPLTKGGTDWITNIQPLCQSCNSKKFNTFATDYRPPHVREWAEEEMNDIFT